MASQGYNIPFLDMTCGKICLSADTGDELDLRRVRDLLVNFGEIYSLDTTERERGKLLCVSITIEGGVLMSLKACMVKICLYSPHSSIRFNCREFDCLCGMMYPIR